MYGYTSPPPTREELIEAYMSTARRIVARHFHAPRRPAGNDNHRD